MTLENLKTQFYSWCNENWLNFIKAKNYTWQNRSIYINLLCKLDYIQQFRQDYDAEITWILNTTNTERNKIHQLNESLDKFQVQAFFIVLITAFIIIYFYIKGVFSLDTIFSVIIAFIISIILGSLISGTIESKKKHFSHDTWLDFFQYFVHEHEKENILKLIKNLDEKESKEYIQNMNPYEFEKLVANVFEYFWYVTKVTKWSWDKWIDINIEKSWEKQIIQCKRYKKKIWTPVVRDFLGTMHLSWIHTWFIVTTSAFSYEVVNMLNNWDYSIKLIDIDIILVLFRIMNDWMKDEDLVEIVDIWMRWIEKKAGDAEWNNFLAKLNYKRNPYLWKKR